MARGAHRATWTVIADEALRIRSRGQVHRQGKVRESMADAAERALEQATEDERRAYKLRYVEGMNYQMASEKMHMSERTFYRTLKRLFDRVEKEMA